jgi:TMEM175 potassium channel family protein
VTTSTPTAPIAAATSAPPPAPSTDERWGIARTETFSDGVFAIAITLLILEVSVPESAFADLWSGIAHQWPSYLAYVTSFITIGGIWIAHHGIFRRLQYVNREVMLVNLLLLMAIAFLPFPTRLMGEAIHQTDATRTAVIFYGASLLAISLLLALMWGTAARDRRVLRPEVSEREITAVALATAPNIGLYGAMILLSLLFPRLAVFGYLVIAVVAVLRMRGDRLPASAPLPELERRSANDDRSDPAADVRPDPAARPR